ncbi:hypothetical protein SAMN05444166_5898 [Singulisphaera sp. GP187]|uniref:hypothetical protein n=1 Tax=Singulisphaera sp. GP187 TaxID=1882752 RepID=UPI000927F486|nr:hypothetical protein [Singulisphaera sp. GP187]SIO59023.1 hypothetical protein SAMN05444166_5898 [Singulisphaera sp. GP187]
MDPSIAVIPIVGMSIPIILVPVSLGLRHARLVRELEHAERMKALELGRTLPKDEPFWGPARLSLAFGLGVPTAVFFFAWMASHEENTAQIPLWISAGVVGLGGVISGAVLAYRQLERWWAGPHVEDYRTHKPANIDEDAFDVVGSRG